MQHKVKVTVLDKNYTRNYSNCAVPDSGKCPCYYWVMSFYRNRNDERD